ncbi:MAG TPA: NADH-quinone oxidoreductase subunit J [Geobacterales bacterium]|jgi:NADH-quinone oxidoreductase subunit J|nr:NADH-quinone oxidoreductase subunit J [Geobacterales bacterium]
MDSIFFAIVAALAVISALMVVISRNPINSALSLVSCFILLAVLYVTLMAPLMAAVQIMVYAGAIMVLIIFVINLLNLRAEKGKKVTHAVLASSIVAALLLVQAVIFVNRGILSGEQGKITTETINTVGHVELIGQTLFTSYLLPFEIASVLLLVAIVGAVVLAKRKI